MKHSVVFVTAPKGREAERLARLLLARKLVACVNILRGVTSFYWWKGKIDRGAETLLVMKTKGTLVKKVIAAVRAAHSYEVCEVIALPILAGSAPYLKWIDASCRGGRS